MQRLTTTHATRPETASRAPTSASALTRKKRAYWPGELYLPRRTSKRVVNGETASRYSDPNPSCTTQYSAMKNAMVGSVPTSRARRLSSHTCALSSLTPAALLCVP